MSTRMDNYPGLHEDNTNSTYCEQCGCRITGGMCKHGIRPPVSTPAFTPGPWAAKDGQIYSEADPQGRTFAVMTHYDHTPEQDANARLIAAAPEMLQALCRIDSNAAESVEWLRRITREAIAKAEGA